LTLVQMRAFITNVLRYNNVHVVLMLLLLLLAPDLKYMQQHL